MFTGAPDQASPGWVMWGKSPEGTAFCKEIIEARKTTWDEKAEGGTWNANQLAVTNSVWRQTFSTLSPALQLVYNDAGKQPTLKRYVSEHRPLPSGADL